MKTVEDYEKIRKAFFVEGLSIRAIHRKLHVDRETIRKAIVQPVPQPYQMGQGRPDPVLGPYKKRIQELLDESDQLPRKQRYTARTIYRLIREEGYQGCEGSVHNYVSRQRKDRRRKDAYLPLEFDAGQGPSGRFFNVKVGGFSKLIHIRVQYLVLLLELTNLSSLFPVHYHDVLERIN